MWQWLNSHGFSSNLSSKPIFSQLFPIYCSRSSFKAIICSPKKRIWRKTPSRYNHHFESIRRFTQKKASCHLALFFASAKYMEFPWETFSTSKFQREKHRVIIDSVWIFHSQRLCKMSVTMAKKHQHGTSNLTPFFSKTSSNFPEPCETNLKIKRNDRQC